MNLKILCFNIHKGFGWRRNSTIDKIKHKISGLNFNILFLQEIRGSQVDYFSPDISYYYAYGKNAVNASDNHGNAIFSEYPIVYSKNTNISMHRFERRGLLHAVIKIPGSRKLLHLVCVHLGLREKDRKKQLSVIAHYLEKNIAKNEPLILGGDFNDWREYATEMLVNQFAFQEAFLNSRKNYAKTYPAWIPILKLDRLYYRGLTLNYAHRLIEKPWRSLSDHVALMVSLKMDY
jgi:endonuclease/exonuclease/phosphatase family metal-dependent hydrolase